MMSGVLNCARALTRSMTSNWMPLSERTQKALITPVALAAWVVMPTVWLTLKALCTGWRVYVW